MCGREQSLTHASCALWPFDPFFCLRDVKYLLEEIVLAEQLPVAGETFLIQLHPTFATLQTLGVPGPVGHL